MLTEDRALLVELVSKSKVAVLCALCVVAAAAGCGGSNVAPGGSTSADGGNAPPDGGVTAPDGGGPDGGAVATPDDLSALLAPIRARFGLPGLAAAVMRGKTLAGIGATGVRKLGDATPVTTADKWHLGSDGKAMTATVVARLVEAGTLRWDTTLATALPGVTMDVAWRTVTLELLLGHRGGAPGDIPAAIWSRMWTTDDQLAARRHAVEDLLASPPAQTPGTTFVYANAGYIIVGRAMEVATGASWETLMRRELFEPLGMASCGFGSPATPGVLPPDQPWAHRTVDGGLVPQLPGPQSDNPPSAGPAGTIHCSLADWGKFVAAHLRGARGEGGLVSVASFTKLQTPWPGGEYALGWGVTTRSWGGGTVLTHSGSNTLFFATTWLAPARDTAFLVATNRGDDAAAAGVDTSFGPLIERYLAP